MPTETKCDKCGKDVAAGTLVCPVCGAVLTADFSTGLPGLGADLGGVPFKPVAVGGTIDLAGLRLDLGAEVAGQGRPYKAVLAVGRGAEGGDLPRPFAAALLPGGEFAVLHFCDDAGRTQIRRFDAGGKSLAVLGPFESGSGESAFNAPAGLAAAGEGRFFVVDMGASRIVELAPDGRRLRVLGKPGTGPTDLENPQAAAVDAAGHLVIADTGNNRIVKWDAQGGVLLTVGINRLDPATGWLMSGDAPGELDEPAGVCLDEQDRIYVADGNNHRVQVFGPEGKLLRAFGEEGSEPGQLYYPRVVRVGGGGDIWVADSKYGRIQKFNPDGQFIYQVVMPADAGLVDDFAVDESGRLLVVLRKADLVLQIEVQ